jgi:hypothetical protein
MNLARRSNGTHKYTYTAVLYGINKPAIAKYAYLRQYLVLDLAPVLLSDALSTALHLQHGMRSGVI